MTRRLERQIAEDDEPDSENSDRNVAFEFVILDEAGAMLEPDVLGTLLHGARAMLLVGDHYQLPPFSRWQEAERAGYTVSLMERLYREASRRRFPQFMLTEQYRMHADICQISSRCFYNAKLLTADVTANARTHALPAAFIDCGGNEVKPSHGTSLVNEHEAAAVLKLVHLLIAHASHAPEQINVVTFYNGQVPFKCTMRVMCMRARTHTPEHAPHASGTVFT